MRLQVFLSHNGVCSRRNAMGIIQEGRVCVNGKIITEPSMDVQGDERIEVDGKRVGVKQYRYVMLNKPVGFTTTKDDPYADKTVMDLLPKELWHTSPVGRLDRDSEGLLLLTNDGDFSYRLTHPKFHLPKTYQIVVSNKLKPESVENLKKGVMVEGKKTAPCQIKNVRYNDGTTELIMIIHEGRKRQIRLMMLTQGHIVKRLIRLAVGEVKLADLPSGQWRELTAQEINLLKEAS